jgi:hypothetical protein
VTANAKLQIWDLSVSSMDPLVSLDTSEDDVAADYARTNNGTGNGKGRSDKRASTSSSSPPGSPGVGALSPGPAGTGTVAGGGGGRFGRGDHRDDDKDPRSNSNPNPIAQLLKSLAQPSERRVLTCLQFGEKSPTVVVGDNRGAVTVYRVLDPLLITHAGPMQQTARLKAAGE